MNHDLSKDAHQLVLLNKLKTQEMATLEDIRAKLHQKDTEELVMIDGISNYTKE